jgi:hypothetical protein
MIKLQRARRELAGCAKLGSFRQTAHQLRKTGSLISIRPIELCCLVEIATAKGNEFPPLTRQTAAMPGLGRERSDFRRLFGAGGRANSIITREQRSTRGSDLPALCVKRRRFLP